MEKNREYQEMCDRLQKAANACHLDDEIEIIRQSGTEQEKKTLEMLLKPENLPLSIQLADCIEADGKTKMDEADCLFEEIRRDENGKLIIGDGKEKPAISKAGDVLANRKDTVSLLQAIKDQDVPVYAMIAPAFSGQFSDKVDSGKLRTAFKRLGFYGMVEVALFADVVTLKEALEFEHSIKSDKDFVLTSCCCPMWMALIRKNFTDLVPHIPPSVSPMVACGRSIKRLHPKAITVFVGPCIAKKAEAKLPDIKDSTDYVLTFDEVAKMFKDADLDLASLPEDTKDHSSTAGRIYAHTGGVSKAVQMTFEHLCPDHKFPLRSIQANGIMECKKLLADVQAGNIKANFMEGMGCIGGCVGGPRSLLSREEATKHVDDYGAEARYETPAENPYVLEILLRLGFDTVGSLLHNDDIFTRDI